MLRYHIIMETDKRLEPQIDQQIRRWLTFLSVKAHVVGLLFALEREGEWQSTAI